MLSEEDRGKVRSTLTNALMNIARKYPTVEATEIKALFNEALVELERKGMIRRGEQRRD